MGYKRHKGNKALSGSLTVEASLVMTVTLFLIAAMITRAFDLHSDVVGRFVLQDGLEQAVHMEKGQKVELIKEWATCGWQEYFWCKGRKIYIEEQNSVFEGKLDNGSGAEILVKRFEPEQFLRFLRAVGV